MIDRNDITGVILCGGAARRMNGVEKPLQLLAERPLVAHVRERLAPQVARVVISANREREAYAEWGDAVIADEAPDIGPLGGLVSVMPMLRTKYVFCCPGDAPFLDRSLVSRLSAALDGETAHLCVPHDGRRAQHLFLLLRTSERGAMSDYLRAGLRSVHGWIAQRGAKTVDASDIPESFRNINSEPELRSAELKVARERPPDSSTSHSHALEPS